MPEIESLRQLVARHLPGSILTDFEILDGGVSADVTRLDLIMSDGEKRSFVLREHGSTHDGNELATEFATLQTLHGAGLAVPQPIACDASCELLNHPWLLMTFVAGSTEFSRDTIEARIDVMVSEMIRLHQSDIKGLSFLPRTVDPLPELYEWAGKRVEWRELRSALQLVENTVYADEPVLLHGDFWPGNIIWDEHGAIRAVLDWEDASLGDPIFDVACTCLELRYLFGKTGAEQFRKAYETRRPLDPARFALWQAYAGVWAFDAMRQWNLAPQKEDKMRKDAADTVREALRVMGA